MPDDRLDLLGLALSDRTPGDPLLVERSDGHTSTVDVAWWCRLPTAEPPGDLTALQWVRPGAVLDVGCCTGRHLELLAGRGVTGYGIDVCATAVALGRAAGIACEQADAWSFRPARPVDTVLALGGNLGIAGSRQALPTFLGRLAGWLAPGGSIIVSSVDWRISAGQHQKWVGSRKAQGRYPGDIRLRLRYREHVGQWFSWVLVDTDTLDRSCAVAGLVVTDLTPMANKYVARLRRAAG